MSDLDIAQKRAEAWLNSDVDVKTKEEVQKLINGSDSLALVNSFYKNLEFGTGGLRGIMGVGSNCINKYTIATATQGFANYLKKQNPSKKLSVVIGYDCRNNSKKFAQITANVFSSNGIEVFLFPELRPTPLLSFAIRYLKCDGGVVITASHNPKEYNGYKAYWNDGAQLIPPHDQGVIDEVNAIDRFDQIDLGGVSDKIHQANSEVEDAYYKEVKKLIPKKDSISRQKNIPIVYTSLHGAGITMVPDCLKRIGFTNIILVEEQSEPNGNFPTVKSPNPEEESAMEMALLKGKKEKAALVMATDPDADRVGIGIMDGNGKYFLLNGNQALSLMMWFILKNRKGSRQDAYIVKTIVTTELIDAMAKQLGVDCINTLTGFKYIADVMNKHQGHFVAAGEESYGYIVGDFVRDKDAVSACAFFAAMAAAAADEDKSLFDWLLEMYIEFGFYKENLVNVVRKGAEGEKEIKVMMDNFRNSPPTTITGQKVISILDYLAGTSKNLVNGKVESLDFPKSNVLQFYLEDGSKISVRPSGTEPKIKFYVSVMNELLSPGDFQKVNALLDLKIKSIETEIL